MVPRTPSLVLLALCALATCLSPEYHCRILCGGEKGETCPDEFVCHMNTGRCARMEVGLTCPALGMPMGAGGAGGGSPPMDAAPETSTAIDSPEDSATLGPADAGDPPAEICYGSNCIALSAETRQALALWLDPHNLPVNGTQVARWPDRSGRLNDALALSGTALPVSTGSGLRLHPGPGGALRVLQQPTLDFGTGDFTILIMARVMSTMPSCFYAGRTGDRTDPRGVELRWAFSMPIGQPSFQATVNTTTISADKPGLGDQLPHLFVLRRTGAMAELRIDGDPVAYATLADADRDTSNKDHIILGGCSPSGWPIELLHAVVVLRGELPATDLSRLEAHLRQSFPRTP